MYKILITSAGGQLAPMMCSLMKKGHFRDLKVIGANNKSSEKIKHFFDHFVNLPNGKNNKYIKELIKIIKKYRIDFLIPGSDEEAIKVSKKINLFKKLNCEVSCVKSSILKIFNSKLLTYKYLQKHKLPCANFFHIKSRSELLKKITSNFKNKEFAIKPSISRGGRGIYIIRNDIKKIISKNNFREFHVPSFLFNPTFIKKNIKFPLILMERLYEPTYDLDLLGLNGRAVTIVCRKRLVPEEPNEGHIIFNDKKLKKIGETIIQKFNLSWLYDCDLMLDKKGNYKIIEINPRLSGSTPVAVLAGYSLYDNLIAIARKKKFFKNKKKISKLIIPYTGLFSKN